MRAALRLGAAAAAILAGGCRQSESEVLGELRHQMMQRCGADMAAATAQYPAFDIEKFCGCLTDKAFAGKNAREVRELFGDREKMKGAARQAAVECRPSDTPDLPPLDMSEPAAPAAANKAKAADRPRRTENAARPRAEPRAPAGGPVATPRPMPVPPEGRTPAPSVPPGFGTPPTPPRASPPAPPRPREDPN